MKLFRKLRYSLLANKKFSQYLGYALGEIVLVVIGILIALQLNILNEQRKLNKEEIEILESLLLNLKQAHNQSLEHIDDENQTIDLGLKSLGLIQEEGFALNDTLTHSLLWDLESETPVLNTYSDLKSSGKIALIKNDLIRERFAKLEIGIEGVKLLANDRLTVQQIRIDNLAESEVNFVPLLRHYTYELDYSKEMPNDYTGFMRKPETRNLIAMRTALTYDVLKNRIDLDGEIVLLIALIEEELVKKKGA